MAKTSLLQRSLDFPVHINRGLFADDFLDHHLPELPEWQADDGLEAAFNAALKLYHQRAARFTTKTNESQTENDFVRPLLKLLWSGADPGDCYQVQVRIPNVDSSRQPDYALFRAAADRTAADPLLGSMDYWREAWRTPKNGARRSTRTVTPTRSSPPDLRITCTAPASAGAF